MNTNHDLKNIRLTAAEIGELWLTYVGDTMTKCILSYFEKTVQDPDIHEVIKFLLEKNKKHLEMASDIFKSVGFPIPEGFGDSDVNLEAKKLYSDVFILNYLKFAAKFGMMNQGLALTMVTREDVRKFFDEYVDSYKDLSNRTDSLLLEKGLYMRCPATPVIDSTEYVENKRYLSGFLAEFFGQERPINDMEIAHAYWNIQTNALGKALLMGFAQVTDNAEIRSFFIRGKEMANKFINEFSALLKEADLPVPMLWDAEVTDSTERPFSDKLMMFHTTALISFGIGLYGLGFANSMRSDISLTYARISGETALYSKDGAVIMINNGWLEKPPGAVNHNEVKNI